jgi:hypothetical protein
MPTDALTVKFRCVPLQETGDPELDAAAPMLQEAAECMDPPPEEVAKLPLAAPLEIPVMALVDPGGRGVRCVSPPVLPPWAGDHVRYYNYFVDLSFDGRTYLPRSLPFDIFNLKVTGLEPNVGPLTEGTEVKIVATGVVRSDVLWVRVDFPKHLGWASQRVPARYDETTEEIKFNMVQLTEAKVAQLEGERLDGERKIAAELERSARLSASLGLSPRPEKEEEASPTAADPGAEGGKASPEPGQDGVDCQDGEPGEPPSDPDPNGGLSGLEVFVAVSLNGQNFTGPPDPNGGAFVSFTYYGMLEPVPGSLKLISLPDGYQAEAPPPEDKKSKPKGGKAAEEAPEPSVPAGATVGCEAKGLAVSSFAKMRVELKSGPAGAGEEELQPFRSVVVPARVESVVPPAPTPPPADPKSKNEPPPQAEEPEPVEMLLALTPSIDVEELPKDASGAAPNLYMTRFEISLNGQSFVEIPNVSRMKLEPLGGQR